MPPKSIYGKMITVLVLTVVSASCNVSSPSANSKIQAFQAPIALSPDAWRNPQLAFTFSGGGAHSLAISPDGKTLVSGDKTVKVWNLQTGKLLHSLSGTNPIAISADEPTIISRGDETNINIWNLVTGELKTTIPGDFSAGFELSANGKIFATGNYDNPKKAIAIWDISAGKVQRTLSEGGNPMVISPDGKILVSISKNQPFKIWNLTTGELIGTFSHEDEILSAVISPDGKTLALGSYSQGEIDLFDLPTGKLIRTLPGGIYSLAFSPNNQILASGGEGNVELWNLPTGKLLATLKHSSQVASLTFSPDGKLLAGGTGRVLDVLRGEMSVKVWRVSGSN